MRLYFLLGLLLCSLACKPPVPSSASPTENYRQVLDQIADRCGVPRSTFKLIGDGKLTIQAPPMSNDGFDHFQCAYEKLMEANLPLQLGFIGNEYYVDETK